MKIRDSAFSMKYATSVGVVCDLLKVLVMRKPLLVKKRSAHEQRLDPPQPAIEILVANAGVIQQYSKSQGTATARRLWMMFTLEAHPVRTTG
jgi:hypothetical protein